MREILFRGFTPDENGRETITVKGKQIKGEWVQGSYWELRETTYCFQSDYDRHPDNTKYYIVFDRMTDWGLPNRHLQADVIPETVGQFTGLTDKNGKKIFEGDIVQYSIEEDQAVFVGAVKFGEFNPDGGALLNTNVGFYVEMVDQEGKRTYMQKDIGFWVKFRQIEVIGNIYDNPELLETA